MGDLLKGNLYRGFNFRRVGKNLEWTFGYRLEDDSYGVSYWQLVPLHPTSQAKSGDKTLSLGTTCYPYEDGLSYSYDAKRKYSKLSFSRHANGVVRSSAFSGTLNKVRDEVDSLALIGFNKQGERVVFHIQYSYTGPRRGGTIWGKIHGLTCNVSVIMLPIAQGVYMVSSKALEALDLVGVPAAGDANLMLKGFSIYAGVDSYGRVKGTFGIKFDGSASDKAKALEFGQLAVETMLAELTGELIDEIYVANPKWAPTIDDGIFLVDAWIYLEDWQSAREALAETVDQADFDLCNYWH